MTGRELSELSAAQKALANVETPAEAKALYDQLETLSQYARRVKANHEQQNEIAEVKLRTVRKGGKLLAGQPNRYKSDSRRGSESLPDGFTWNMSSRWQQVAAIDDDEFEDHIAAVKAADDEELTLTGLLRFDVLGVHFSSDTGEWSTPQDLFDELDQEFGFELDVCATAANAKCADFFTKDEDGLAQRWRGSCFMNPPYGSQIGIWVEKAAEEASRIIDGCSVVCLLPARTDTAWFWDYCRLGEIRFLRGRLRFGDSEMSAPFPSAVVVFPGKRRVIWWER